MTSATLSNKGDVWFVIPSTSVPVGQQGSNSPQTVSSNSPWTVRRESASDRRQIRWSAWTSWLTFRQNQHYIDIFGKLHTLETFSLCCKFYKHLSILSQSLSLVAKWNYNNQLYYSSCVNCTNKNQVNLNFLILFYTNAIYEKML